MNTAKILKKRKAKASYQHGSLESRDLLDSEVCGLEIAEDDEEDCQSIMELMDIFVQKNHYINQIKKLEKGI